MNRFRNKKKAAKEANEAAGRASNESEVPPIPVLKTSKTFMRGKKTGPVVEEPKVELDLSTALPSSEDFRTSLLMSGLSARFSMLREQDDPKSKLGKASDDSVLFPKRQSRLDNFASFSPQGLSDIAEVNSIRGSNQMFRPPFATAGNTNSYHSTDGYGTDDDSANGSSIMGRSKPGEGNNLFGGRQKIYHIPLKAAGESPNGSGMRGRARYDDDISQSAFQRFKERERQQREHEEEQARLADDAAQIVRSSSPPLSGYNRNRETSSTTSSGPTNTRTSTAATSINSQSASPNVSNMSTAPSIMGSTAVSGTERTAPTTSGLERNVTKTRRLYETGLEKNLHEQQHSAMNRIDSLTRQHTLRSQTPPLALSSPTSVTNLSERFERHEISTKPSQASLRAVSPPPSASIAGKFEYSAKPANPSMPQSPFGEPPLSPPMSEGDDALSANLDARDRGKATALGAFNKPAQPYDDLKYSERQMQMKAGREIPQKARPFQPPPPNQGPNQVRSRAESNATANDSTRSRSTSSAQRQVFVPRSRIPELRSNETKSAMQSPPSQTSPLGMPGRSMNPALDIRGFNRNVTGMLIAEEKSASTETPVERPPESQHPANRSAPRLWADFTHGDTETDLPNPSILLSKVDAPNGSVKPSSDSPTLGPTTGLSGMVRQHMRSDSNASSFFGAPSPALGSHYPQDPWNLEDWNREKMDDQPTMNRKMKGANFFSALPPPLSIKASKVEPLVLDDESAKPPPLAIRSPNIESFKVEEPAKPSFEKDLLAHHKRDGSTATQQETQNFANELAQRRRRVQENLKSFAESDSRSNSPVPDMDWTKETNRMKNNPLGILKAKSSRESIVNMQVRSRRMLGLGNATISSSSPSPNKQAFDEEMWQREEEEMLRGLSKGPSASSPRRTEFRREGHKLPERYWIAEGENELSEPGSPTLTKQRTISEENEQSPNSQIKPNHNQGRETDEQVMRKPSQESKNSAGSGGQSRSSSRAARDRSSSSTSGRSKSRNGVYRDDLAKAMAEGIGSSTRPTFEEEHPSRMSGWPPTTPIMSSQPTVPSPMNGPSIRSRSHSRPPPPKPATGYFDNQSLHPLLTGENTSSIGLSPRPSPVTPFSVNSTPSLTPNGSGTNTPITQAQSFQSQNRALARKKTINKADISEPTLVSTTSQIDTVNLPQGASLKNGLESAPPVPPINPRRRQTRIQTMVGVFSSNKSSDSVPTLPSHSTHHSPVEDQSTFSADENEMKKPRKLRKSSSEGGNLHMRARQLASTQPSPAMPSKEQGGMF